MCVRVGRPVTDFVIVFNLVPLLFPSVCVRVGRPVTDFVIVFNLVPLLFPSVSSPINTAL